MRSDMLEKPHRSRGIYLLPNLFTVAAMFAGFYAIMASMRGYYENAAIALFVAMLMDGLDGRIARLTNTQSEFGAQLDSLSDMLCFGLTPALVLYSWSLHVLGKPGWLIAFIYVVCTALRLARFNTQLSTPDKRYFQGLSTPSAAALVASFVWACSTYEIGGASMAFIVAGMTVVLALLKVSAVRYRSFKDLDFRNKVPFIVILAVILVFVFISFDPPDILFAIVLLYVLSGPFHTLCGLRKRRRLKQIRREKRKERQG